MARVPSFRASIDERVATLAFTLKVRPVTGRTDFQALLFHFNPGKLAFELRNARVQVIDRRTGDRLVIGRAAACTESRRDRR